MADPTASVTFGVIAFQVGTEVWDEGLQVDLARERLLSQRGAILSDVKPSPRIVTVKGMILGTAAAGPRADARADIDALAGAFLREEGDWLKLWTDRRCWARCVRCDLSQEQGTGYAIAFDGDFEIGDPTWESTDTTSFGGTMDGGLGDWDTRETRLVDYTGTAETGLFVRFIGRVSVGGIRAVNRFGNIVNNSTFGQVTASRYGGSATQAGVPDKWIADGYGETGLSFGSACRIWRGTTSIQTNPSFVYQDLPWVEDGDKISAQVHITLEHGSGTGYQGWFELEFYTKADALISTLTSPLCTTLEGSAETIQLLNQTVPANTWYIRLKLQSLVNTGGSLLTKFYAPIVNRGATINPWAYNQRDHDILEVTSALAANEMLEVDYDARKVAFRALNAWEVDGRSKLTSGLQTFLRLLPGDNELLFEHAGGGGYVHVGANYVARYWTP